MSNVPSPIPDTPESTTAKEQLHDIDALRKNKEYQRYWGDYYAKKMAEAHKQFVAAECWEDCLVWRALYLEYELLSKRMDIDEVVNNRLLQAHNAKSAPK